MHVFIESLQKEYKRSLNIIYYIFFTKDRFYTEDAGFYHKIFCIGM